MNIFTQPDNPQIGDLWYDKITNVLFLYDGSDWITANNETLNTYIVKSEYPYRGFSNKIVSFVADEVPENPKQGDLWLNTVDRTMHIYNENEWVILQS